MPVTPLPRSNCPKKLLWSWNHCNHQMCQQAFLYSPLYFRPLSQWYPLCCHCIKWQTSLNSVGPCYNYQRHQEHDFMKIKSVNIAKSTITIDHIDGKINQVMDLIFPASVTACWWNWISSTISTTSFLPIAPSAMPPQHPLLHMHRVWIYSSPPTPFAFPFCLFLMRVQDSLILLCWWGVSCVYCMYTPLHTSTHILVAI